MTPKKISVDTFKSNFDEILRRVEMGESFTVLSEGMPAVDLIQSRASRKREVRTAVENILSASKHTVSDQSLAALREGGRD